MKKSLWFVQRTNTTPKYTKYKICLSIMVFKCIKQHLSNIRSSIHEKVKQHWGWVEKSVAYLKKACNQKVWEGFSFIFCLTHLNNNFDSSHGEFNVMTGNFDNFLGKRKKFHFRFLTCFWIYLCRVIYIQRHSSRDIWKDNFSESFFKIAKEVSLSESFSKRF